ncbi:uncharacterized protein [Dysidea avara]|uniref:uncharacterized protein n=1 Tax=Dysidea avara TaxID=196820 RepID=UPI0033216EFA
MSIVPLLTLPSPDAVGLNLGLPSPQLMEKTAQLFCSASSHCATRQLQTMTQYGPENGDEHFRELLADFLSRQYQADVLADELYVTAGATNGLSLISTLLFEARDNVYIEDPSFFFVFKIFKGYNFNVISVPTDSEGIIPSSLEETITSHNSKPATRQLTEAKPYRGMIYLIPTFHNPTGKCLSPDRYKEVIAIARRHNLLIVCDDVYNLLYFTDKPPTRLYSYDTKSDPDYAANVVSNGTFSKIFSPGIRLGWIEAPYKVLKIIADSGLALSGGCFNHTVSCVMASAISLGYVDNTVDEYRAALKSGCEVVTDVLTRELPKEVQVSQPMGGYYVWVSLPDGMEAQSILDECLKGYNINFQIGSRFSADGNFKNCFRISYSFYKPDTLRFAAEKITAMIKKYL